MQICMKKVAQKNAMGPLGVMKMIIRTRISGMIAHCLEMLEVLHKRNLLRSLSREETGTRSGSFRDLWGLHGLYFIGS